MKSKEHALTKAILISRKKSSQKSLPKQPTSTQNRFRAAQKQTKIGPRADQNCSKIGPWASQNPPKTQWQQRTHEHPRADFYFWPKCRQHGPNLAPQTDQKSEKNRSKNRSNFELLLGSILIPKITPKTTPKSIKNQAKIDFKSEQAKNAKMLKNYWFFNDFCGSGESTIDQKSIQNRFKS